MGLDHEVGLSGSRTGHGSRLLICLVLMAVAAGCSTAGASPLPSVHNGQVTVTPSPMTEVPAACLSAAQDYQGTVSAAFTSTVGAIRKLPAVADNPQLDGYSSDDVATVCYIDGEIPKGPPPGTSGTIPPSFDRAVLVVVGQSTFLVAAGYRQNLPTQAP